MLALFLGAGVVVLVIGGIFALSTTSGEDDRSQSSQSTDSVFSEEQFSRFGQFRHAAVATDNRDCASIGV